MLSKSTINKILQITYSRKRKPLVFGDMEKELDTLIAPEKSKEEKEKSDEKED